MKIKLVFILLFLRISTYGQSGSFIVGIDHIQKTNHFFHYLLSDKSLGLKFGYSQILNDDIWTIDFISFANYIDYHFNLTEDRYFDGGTLFTGIGIMPQYCLNPKQKLRVSIGAMLKGQQRFGQGNVFERHLMEPTDQSLEKKFINSGFSLDFSPHAVIEYPINAVVFGVETGWDSSDIGKGMNQLKSIYYKPINYHSTYVFLGFFLKL